MKTKKILYSAVVLDDKSHFILVKRFSDLFPNDWEIIAHHMTITLGELKDKSIVGKEFKLNIKSFGKDEKVAAVKVETSAPSKNKTKHITLAVNRQDGGKPYMSNNIEHWIKLKDPFVVSGVVQEISANS